MVYSLLFRLKWLHPVIVGMLLLAACKFPYDPQPEPPPGEQTVKNVGGRRVFPINGHRQICNPSIALDITNFSGCMLFLNFDGAMAVNVPEGMDGFTLWASMHDRLTVVDTTNTVRWFMMRDELGADEREGFQDPEWAAHPDYIVALLSTHAMERWGGWAIHPRTRKKILLCRDSLIETSTPHLWVEAGSTVGEESLQVRYDEEGFADSSSVVSFFGTARVKIIVSLAAEGGGLSLYYRDYSAGGGLVALTRPDDRNGWKCESPLISPDGQWVVYNAWKNPDSYESYLQELSPDSRPILFAEEGTSDPHWWIQSRDSSLLYVVYQEVSGTNLVYGDYADPDVLTSGELGKTLRQLVRLFPGASSQAASISLTAQPEVLANVPTKGGLSPDGRYLATGFDRAFIVGLP